VLNIAQAAMEVGQWHDDGGQRGRGVSSARTMAEAQHWRRWQISGSGQWGGGEAMRRRQRRQSGGGGGSTATAAAAWQLRLVVALAERRAAAAARRRGAAAAARGWQAAGRQGCRMAAVLAAEGVGVLCVFLR
jgi:hypothetical protein